MINKDRIVPVQKTDLLTLYGTVLNLIGTSHTVLESPDVDGDFEVPAAGGTCLCNQPAKTIDFGEATAATVYFIPAYDFAGFGEEYTGDVVADGATLHKAVLADSAITVTVL